MDEQAFFLRQNFDDFDAFCENARNWDLDFHQLERGSFCSDLLMFGNASTIFSRAKLERGLLQRGASPAGLITFGLLNKPDSSMHWRNLDIQGNNLFIFPPNRELHCISRSDFDVFLLSLSEEVLDKTCHAFELPDFRKLTGCHEVFNCHPTHMSQLRTWLRKFERELINNFSDVSSSVHLKQLEEKLARYLITTLAESTDPACKPVMRKRDHALKTVINHIEESAGLVASSVPELCQIAGVSERTLEYAFRERYSLSPKAFTLIHRLNNVRKMLKDFDPDTVRIYEIAKLHGFTHVSQFVHDYKRLFGVLPSDTLQKKD